MTLAAVRNGLAAALLAVCLLVGLLSGGGAAQFGHADEAQPGISSTSEPLAATAPGDCEFIDDPNGGSYPDNIGLTCWDGTADDTSFLDVRMEDAWAYAVVIELPDDAPREMGDFRMKGNPPKADWTGGNGLTPAEEAPRDERKAIWETKLLASESEDIVVVHSNPTWTIRNCGGGTCDGIYYKKASFDDRITLQPGIYELKLHAYPPHTGTRHDPIAGVRDLEEIDMAIDKSPRKTSYARISIGGCEPEYDPKAKLDALDRQTLQVLSEVGEIQREYELQREQFAGNSAALGAQVGLSIFTSGTAGPPIGTAPADMYLNVQKGREQVDKLSEQTEEMAEINDRREAIREEIDRCLGGPYQTPENYQPLTPADRKEARQPGGDTRKDA